jgi:hypothetical protein
LSSNFDFITIATHIRWILHRATIPEIFTNKGGALNFYIDDASIEALFPAQDYTREKFT